MKRFYKHIDILLVDRYQGSVFSGVQFKDHEGQIVYSDKRHESYSYSTNTWTLLIDVITNVFGDQTDTSSDNDWISLGGPIKGSYVVKVD